MNKRDNENSDLRVRYLKYWLIAVLVFGIIVLLAQVVINRSSNPIKDKDLFEYHLMKHWTPDYPPPLYNFMDFNVDAPHTSANLTID